MAPEIWQSTGLDRKIAAHGGIKAEAMLVFKEA
jgi:hypothetical protein